MVRIFHILKKNLNVPTQSYRKEFKKRYQVKWENAYLTVKNAKASRAGLRPIF